MIRLTKKNFRFTFNGLIITGEDNTLFTSDGQKEIYNQILDDYEKARKFDVINNKCVITVKPDGTYDIDYLLNRQNQKLRELVEKRIKHEKSECSLYPDAVYPYCLDVLQKLLEESKK